jgi:hypothetical protein
MSRVRLRTPLLGALIIALISAVVFLGGAASADAKDNDARTRSYQQQFLDPQAPIGTEPKSSKTSNKAAASVELDSPVQTQAEDPDSTADLKAVPTNDGGRWSQLPSLPTGSNAYHLIMGPGGKILLIAGSGNNSAVFEAGTFKSYIWNPSTGSLKQLTTPTDMFCAGHMLMSNGQGVAAGGTTDYSPWKGSKALYTHIFLTANAKYFFTGAGWVKAPEDVDSSSQFFHPGFWQPFSGNKFTKVNDLTVPTRRGFGSSCWLGSIRRQRLMVMGGGWPATSSTNVIDLDSSSAPKYKAGPSLRAAKVYVSCVQLPDGSVLELGGGSANKIENASQEVSLLKTPTSTSWTAMNPLPDGEHRLYHSMAFLADDGSVISLSSNPKGQARSDTVLRFEPPYMFNGERPTLGGLPSEVTYGQTYSINVTSDVTRVIMMSPASPTHSFDANQREIPLQYADGKITINATSSLAPRGYYRLFAINANGAISTAKWTRLR